MVRLFCSVIGFGLLAAAIGSGLIFWLSRDPAIVAAAALGTNTDPALINLMREDAAATLLGWWVLVVAAFAAAALVWLILALRRRPETPAQARSGRLGWVLLLAVAVVAAVAASYAVYVNEAVAGAWRFAALALAFVVTPVAYWLTTAFGVVREMAPSVPLATLVRS